MPAFIALFPINTPTCFAISDLLLEFNFKSPTLLINIVNAFDYFMTYRSENIKDNKFILLEMYFH